MDHTPDRPGNLPPPSGHHYLPRPDGARLALYTDGPDAAPVTVVLAHGWCATASIWHDHARHLAARGIRVIRYDQRGHGASLSGTSTAFTRLLADDLAAVLRHTRRRTRVVVAGHSMGGMGVLQLAAHHPTVAARLSGVLLVATSSGQMDLTGAQHPPLERLVGRARHTIAALCLRLPGATQTVRDLLSPTSDPRPPIDVAADWYRAVTAHHIEPGALASLSGVPVHVMEGEHDRLVSAVHALRLVSELPHARLHVVPDGRHGLPSEQPAQVRAVLERLCGLYRTQPLRRRLRNA
ncbi:alpha/beta fold hydrolase [Streptomyces sp. NPDC059816]|uniref:alpha/beta fold hydrolase n=1 Tax=Streptomyces sp. NPDC059816 TaxID=3346960 RepID=UPI003669CD80